MPRAKRSRNISATGKLPVWTEITLDKVDAKRGRTHSRLLWEAQDYVHYEIKDATLAKSFIKYCEQQEFNKSDIRMVARMPDAYLVTPGKWAYINLKGAELTEEIHAGLKREYDDLLQKARQRFAADDQQETAPKKTAPVISIQQRMQEQLGDLYGEFELAIDKIISGELKSKEYDAYAKIKSYDVTVKGQHAKMLREYFQTRLNEYQEVAQFQDKDIQEAYGHIPARRRKDILSLLESIITACDTVINTKAAVRKPRKKKAPSVEKMVSRIKFLQSDPTLGLASVPPEKIIGASQVWVYNTKTRKLGVYHADDLHGALGVKGASIINYDPQTSMQRTVRKPEQVMKGAGKLARTKIAKLYGEIKTTETKLTGRMNEHTLIVRVF